MENDEIVLRDLFAANLAPAIFSTLSISANVSKNHVILSSQETAERAYAIAERMILERRKYVNNRRNQEASA